MSLSPEELELRKSGLGASEIACITGLHPWRSALSVWLEKTGRAEPRPPTSRSELGNRMEPIIADWYVSRRSISPVSWTKPKTMVHPLHSWALATPDLLLEYGDGRRTIAEFKLVGSRVRSHWEHGIPGYVVAQVLWQQFVSGIYDAEVGVWFSLDDDDRDVLRCPYDATLAADMAELAHEFWHRNVLADTPPPVEPTEDWVQYIAQRYRTSSGPVVCAPPGADRLVQQYLAAKVASTKAEEVLLQAKNELQWMIGFAEGMDGDDFRVTWKSDSKGKPDWKAIAQALGPTEELIAQHTGPPPRRFLVRAKK